MKTIKAIIASVLLASCNSNVKQALNSKDSADGNNQKVLVAYYSATGTTETVAKEIAKQTGGVLYSILPETPFSSEDLNWRDNQSRSYIEMHDDNCRPPLGGDSIDASTYSVIFLGFPNWWNLPPRIINSWIESQKIEGKIVIPFMTSGGSGIENSVSYLRTLYPNIKWYDGKLLNDGEEQVKKWLETLK